MADKNVVESSVPDELEAAGAVDPAGRSSQGDTSMAVEVGTEGDAVKQIEKTPLRTQDGTVLLGDVADVDLDSIEKPPCPAPTARTPDRIGDQGPGRQCRRRLP